MTKDEIVAIFEEDGVSAADDGNYFEQRVLEHARMAITTDRSSLVEALREWLLLRNDPRTMIAVRAAGELCLKDLRPTIQGLRKEISEGLLWPHLPSGGRRFYLSRVDNALESLA
jgi:hypothetical protein